NAANAGGIALPAGRYCQSQSLAPAVAVAASQYAVQRKNCSSYFAICSVALYCQAYYPNQSHTWLARVAYVAEPAAAPGYASRQSFHRQKADTPALRKPCPVSGRDKQPEV